mmetsp:Transcript_32187/g.88289  ORF Transcript_32187/g.88289 Transcript_32187/m.88289 type:complete len:229 (-) Transcript_32187:153-839(-)
MTETRPGGNAGARQRVGSSSARGIALGTYGALGRSSSSSDTVVCVATVIVTSCSRTKLEKLKTRVCLNVPCCPKPRLVNLMPCVCVPPPGGSLIGRPSYGVGGLSWNMRCACCGISMERRSRPCVDLFCSTIRQSRSLPGGTAWPGWRCSVIVRLGPFETGLRKSSPSRSSSWAFGSFGEYVKYLAGSITPPTSRLPAFTSASAASVERYVTKQVAPPVEKSIDHTVP